MPGFCLFSVAPVTVETIKQIPQRVITVDETSQQEKVIVVEKRRQPEIIMVQRLPPVEREGGDDWYWLFGATGEEPTKKPTGTLHHLKLFSMLKSSELTYMQQGCHIPVSWCHYMLVK